MFEIAKKTFQWGQHTVTLETGEIARQAGGAVIVSMGDTMVLATVVAARKPKPGQSFFPLTVDYFEKFYAAGRIPGGFFKREGRPTEKETLTARLIDRPIRPLFPEGFMNEVQVVLTVLSSNPEIDSDIPAMIGASAALAISGVPFAGPIGAARVGYIDSQYVLNPTASQLKESKLDLVVAGTEQAVLMVESEADELSEEVMLGAVVYGHEQMQVAIDAIDELVEAGGKPEWDWQPAAKNDALIEKIDGTRRGRLQEAYKMRVKQDRQQKIKAIEKRGRPAAWPKRPRRPASRHPMPARWATSCSSCSRRSSAARSSRASRASTAATPAPCDRSRSAPACCRAPTAARCSPAARRRRWWWPRSAPRATSRSSTRSPANIASAS